MIRKQHMGEYTNKLGPEAFFLIKIRKEICSNYFVDKFIMTTLIFINPGSTSESTQEVKNQKNHCLGPIS